MIVSGLSQMAFKHFFWPPLLLRWVDLDTLYKRMTYKGDYSLESILWVASLGFSVAVSQPWSDFIILSINSLRLNKHICSNDVSFGIWNNGEFGLTWRKNPNKICTYSLKVNIYLTFFLFHFDEQIIIFKVNISFSAAVLELGCFCPFFFFKSAVVHTSNCCLIFWKSYDVSHKYHLILAPTSNMSHFMSNIYSSRWCSCTSEAEALLYLLVFS